MTKKDILVSEDLKAAETLNPALINDLTEPSRDTDDSRNAIQRVELRDKAFATPSVSPVARREVGLNTDDKDIVAVNDFVDQQSELEKYRFFQRIARNRQIVYGIVVGVTTTEKAKNIETGKEVDGHLVVRVMIPNYEEFPVCIEDEEFWMEDTDFGDKYYESNDENFKKTTRKRRATEMIFSRVPIVLTEAPHRKKKDNPTEWESKYDYVIMASRKRAMNMIEYSWFFRKNSPLPEVTKSQVYRANVLQVLPTYVRVECCGVESIINPDQLTGKRVITNCRDVVSNGDVLNVLPRRMYVHHKGDPIVTKSGRRIGTYAADHMYFSVSGRRYDSAFKSASLSNLKVGDIEGGIVRSFNDSNQIYTIYLSCGVVASVHQNQVRGRRRLRTNSQVIVQVEKVNDDYVQGRVINY